MNRSLGLSRWKQDVLMSFSSASLQIGRLYFRQKARLHCLQEVEDSRGKRGCRGWVRACVVGEGALALALGSGLGEDEDEDEGGMLLEEGEGFLGGGGGGWLLLLLSCCGPSGMMVLFWKQVHLQKEGTAALVWFSRQLLMFIMGLGGRGLVWWSECGLRICDGG